MKTTAIATPANIEANGFLDLRETIIAERIMTSLSKYSHLAGVPMAQERIEPLPI